MVVFGNKNKSGDFEINFSAGDDSLPNIPAGLAISVTATDSDLTIKPRLGKKHEVHLPYSKITDARVVAETEIIEMQKSTIGRAAVGGFLLGPIGAVIGAADSLNDKKKKQVRRFYIVNYMNSEGEISAVSFEIVGATLGLKKFVELVQQKTGLDNDPRIVTL